MLKQVKLLGVVVALAIYAFVGSACAKKQIMAQPVVVQHESVAPATPAVVAVAPVVAGPVVTPGLSKDDFYHYVVVDGDSLWRIAGKKKHGGDPFRWTLWFKANRDQITDPDLIFANQKLQAPRHPRVDVVMAARKQAMNWPVYRAKPKPAAMSPGDIRRAEIRKRIHRIKAKTKTKEAS